MKKKLFFVVANTSDGQTVRARTYAGAHVDEVNAINSAAKFFKEMGCEMKDVVTVRQVDSIGIAIATTMKNPGGLYICVFKLPAEDGDWCDSAFIVCVTARSAEDAKAEARKAFRLPPNVRSLFLALDRIADYIIKEVILQEV